jgi:competence protein ComEC
MPVASRRAARRNAHDLLIASVRILLLAFSLGVAILQQQEPAVTLACRLCAAACSGGDGVRHLFESRRRLRRRIAYAAALLFVALSVGMGGFFYAAWRAESRLADELPSAWEEQDISLVGIVDDLPQPADRGIRFAFAVEKIVTPDAVVPSRASLAWYNGWTRDGKDVAIPEIHAGERWALTVRLKRPHGTVNPHGFDVEAWLLQNVAAFTPGYLNRFNHPRPEIVGRYAAAGAHNYRTDYDGALTFTFAEGISHLPRRERVEDARYWRDVPVEGRRAPLE